MSSQRCGCLLLSLLLILGMGVHAQESGVTPYAALYQALQPALDTGQRDRLVAVANVQSKLRGVQPIDIRLEIRSALGARVLPVDASGDFDFPLDQALLANEATVVSNQPRGSLTLSVSVRLRPYPTLRVPWNEISRALLQADEAIRSDPAVGTAKVVGLEIWFPAEHAASVQISGRLERQWLADTSGRVVLMEIPQWHEADVEVIFSEQPLRLVPHISRDLP